MVATPIIPATRTLRQEGSKFHVCLGNSSEAYPQHHQKKKKTMAMVMV